MESQPHVLTTARLFDLNKLIFVPFPYLNFLDTVVIKIASKGKKCSLALMYDFSNFHHIFSQSTISFLVSFE